MKYITLLLLLLLFEGLTFNIYYIYAIIIRKWVITIFFICVDMYYYIALNNNFQFIAPENRKIMKTLTTKNKIIYLVDMYMYLLNYKILLTQKLLKDLTYFNGIAWVTVWGHNHSRLVGKNITIIRWTTPQVSKEYIVIYFLGYPGDFAI